MYPKFTADPLADQQPLTPFQRLMPAIRKRFGMIPPAEIGRIKRLRPEQQETLLDVVVMASSLDYFLAQIPGDPAPPRSTRPAEPLTQRLGPALASALGRERSSSQAQAPDFGEPPLIPRQADKLAQAIGMLTDWRTISGDPQHRRGLKALLTRFPENNYQAGLWLQRLQEVQAERDREAVRADRLNPAPQPVETLVTAEVVPALEQPSQVAEPQSETTEMVALSPEPLAEIVAMPSEPPRTETPAESLPDIAAMPVEPALPESSAGSSEPEPGLSLAPAEPEPPAVLSQAVASPWDFAAGKVVEIPTRHPFEVELGLWQTATASPTGSLHLAVTLTLPTEELKFARGVVRRVPGLPALEIRVVEAMRGFFLAAEAELACFQSRPPQTLMLTAPTEPLAVPTLQPFTLTAGWRSQAVDSARTQGVVLCEVPEEELDFALGIARRVPGFIGLAERLAAAAARFFVAVEEELLTFQPVARPEPTPLPVQPVSVAPEAVPQSGQPVSAAIPDLPLFAAPQPAPEPASQPEPQGGLEEVAAKPPEPVGVAPAPTVAAVPTGSVPPAEPLPVSCHAAFRALIQTVREECGGLSRIFSPQVRHLLKAILKTKQQGRILSPVGLLRMLEELTQVPPATCQRLLPLLENVWRSYQPIPANQAGYRSLLPQLEDAWTRFVTRAASPETRPENDHSATGPAPEPAPAALPAATADVPCAGEQPPTPVPAARLHQRREATPAEQKFYAAFAGLTNELKAQGQILAHTFPTARGIAKHAWLGSTVPHPASFLKILADLALLPAAERQKLWPWLEPVLTTYRAVKETSREFGPVAEALAAAEAALMPSTTAELPGPAEPVTDINPDSETAPAPQTEPEAPKEVEETNPEPALPRVPEPVPEAGIDVAAQHPESEESGISDAPADSPVQTGEVAPVHPEPEPKPVVSAAEFFSRAGALIQVVRQDSGSVAKAFPTSVQVVKHLLRGDNIPLPGSFLRVLQDLTRLPQATRDKLWPHLPPFLAAYEGLRGHSSEFTELADELKATAQTLTPEGAFVAAFTKLADAVKARFGDFLKVFKPATHSHIREIVQKKTTPSPKILLKILSELARQPLRDRQALWPHVEVVLERYQHVAKGQGLKRFQEELEPLAGRLAER